MPDHRFTVQSTSTAIGRSGAGLAWNCHSPAVLLAVMTLIISRAIRQAGVGIGRLRSRSPDRARPAAAQTDLDGIAGGSAHSAPVQHHLAIARRGSRPVGAEGVDFWRRGCRGRGRICARSLKAEVPQTGCPISEPRAILPLLKLRESETFRT